jgi:methylase of polypeptide subunit release factors
LHGDFFIAEMNGNKYLYTEKFRHVPIRIKKGGYMPKGGLYLVDYLSSQNISGACLDIGCGETGLIAQYLKLLDADEVVGADIDAPALLHAQDSSPIAPEILWQQSDVYNDIPAGYKFNLIVSNPPQMPSSDIESIHDDGGPDGLDITRRILDGGRQFLAHDGRILLLLFDFLYDNVCLLTNQSAKTIGSEFRYNSRVVAAYKRPVRPKGKTFENRHQIERYFEGFRFQNSSAGLFHNFYIVEYQPL